MIDTCLEAEINKTFTITLLKFNKACRYNREKIFKTNVKTNAI